MEIINLRKINQDFVGAYFNWIRWTIFVFKLAIWIIATAKASSGQFLFRKDRELNVFAFWRVSEALAGTESFLMVISSIPLASNMFSNGSSVVGPTPFIPVSAPSPVVWPCQHIVTKSSHFSITLVLKIVVHPSCSVNNTPKIVY